MSDKSDVISGVKAAAAALSRLRTVTVVLLIATGLLAIGGGVVAYLRQTAGPGSAAATTQPETAAQRLKYAVANLSLGGNTIKLDVADTTQKQELGLGGRSGLAPDQGMIFPYAQSGQRCFWMKDMRFSIDMLWLSADKTVQHIEPSVSPDTYPQTFCPDVQSKYVIELPAGAAAADGVRQGSRLSFDL